MNTVLVDGRVTAADGIGRYTRCLVAALRERAPAALRIEVLRPTGTPRYTAQEGEEIAARARSGRVDLVHMLDYRVPLEPLPCPLVVTIHDVLRLRHPELCYSDADFASRFGDVALKELRHATGLLRATESRFTPAHAPAFGSSHQEFYARMLTLALQRATAVVVPTRCVQHQLEAVKGAAPRTLVSPWGVDHRLDGGGQADAASPVLPRQPYLLYVGQARAHKGVETLALAYSRSQALRRGVRLLFAGTDFADGGLGTQRLSAVGVARHVLRAGQVADAQLQRLYANALAVLHPAADEGFGFPPLEALAVGTRVVASDIPVLRETLGVHALFVPPGDPDQWAAAIDEVAGLDDGPGQRQRRARWAGQYRWARHVDDVLRCYRALLDA